MQNNTKLTAQISYVSACHFQQETVGQNLMEIRRFFHAGDLVTSLLLPVYKTTSHH